MSAQNDTEYVAQVLRFVVRRFNADPRRIYFTGQSQGAMAALAFGVPGTLPAELQPAAIVATSAGAARSHTVSYGGRVRVLLMHGARDEIVPPTVWSGVSRNSSFLNSGQTFKAAAEDALEEARRILGWHSRSTVPKHLRAEAAVLWANALTGGQLLREHQREAAGEVGCLNRWGEVTGISLDGFFYDPFSRTLSGVAGKEVNMSHLTFDAPPNVPRAAQLSMQCANVSGTEALVTACIFNGGHCLPWQNWASYDCGWLRLSNSGRVYHDFVWRDFLRGGNISRL